jgi:hypothetical protein
MARGNNEPCKGRNIPVCASFYGWSIGGTKIYIDWLRGDPICRMAMDAVGHFASCLWSPFLTFAPELLCNRQLRFSTHRSGIRQGGKRTRTVRLSALCSK